MEQDKRLKDILLNSAERPSADFTDTVMKRVNAVSAVPFSYQPLVSHKLKRVFVFIFGALVAAILVLCLLIATRHLSFFNWVENVAIPDLDYRTIVMFILSFWFVFTINAVIEKKGLSRKNPGYTHGN